MDDSRELTILESKGILIKDQLYDGILTNRRIILTGNQDQKPRSILIRDLQKITLDTGESGDPILILSVPSAIGDIKKVILHFSPKKFPDPHQVRLLWYSEINKKLQPTPSLVSPDSIPKKDSGAQVFCVKCGTKFTDGSVFCNKCGTKILYPAQPLPVEQKVEPIQQNVVTPEISTGTIALPPKKSSIPLTNDAYKKEHVPAIASQDKKRRKKKSFFAGSGKRKPAVIVVSALVCVTVVIAAFFVLVPSASRGFDLASSGMNFTTPEVTVAASASSHGVTTPTVSKTPSRLTITPTISKTTITPVTPVRTSVTPVQTSTPVRTSTPVQTLTPVQTSIPQVVIVPPSFNTTPGDPWSVFVAYPTLFNARNSAGIEALLSENMKLHYPLDTVNNELATAQSNGYTIEKIQADEQTIEDPSANLVVTISWNHAGSSATSTPRVFFVYENNQWKLDSLIVSPAS